MEKPLVSIACAAYNHEAYIAAALESFLCQKTRFAFEILVHDDASTDSTAEIIRQYTVRYPEIIRPLYQSQNQYSQGKRVPWINSRRGAGRYIAVCEGDDYWTDPDKLQIQVDFLEAHPACSLCFHAADILDVRSGRIVDCIRPYRKSLILPRERLFSGGGQVCPTASIVYRKAYMQEPPDFYFQAPVGDRALILVMQLNGSIAYLDEVMAVRRLWVAGSWNTRFQQTDGRQERQTHYRRMIELYTRFDQVSARRWSGDVNKMILGYSSLVAQLDGRNPLDDAACRRRLKLLGPVDRLKYRFKWLTPAMHRRWRRIRRALQRRVHGTGTEDSQVLREQADPVPASDKKAD